MQICPSNNYLRKVGLLDQGGVSKHLERDLVLASLSRESIEIRNVNTILTFNFASILVRI